MQCSEENHILYNLQKHTTVPPGRHSSEGVTKSRRLHVYSHLMYASISWTKASPIPAAQSISQLRPTNSRIKEQIHRRRSQPTQPPLPPSMSELRFVAQNMAATPHGTLDSWGILDRSSATCLLNYKGNERGKTQKGHPSTNHTWDYPAKQYQQVHPLGVSRSHFAVVHQQVPSPSPFVLRCGLRPAVWPWLLGFDWTCKCAPAHKVWYDVLHKW
jgi:hypothetical protein